KPSEKVPSASLRMAELFKEAGLPDGVLNVVHGDKEAVDAILNHPGIHAVVLPDADLEFAADALIGAAYGSAGERCMAISAVVAVGACADPLVKLLKKKAKAIKIGAGDAEGVDMGPL